VHHEIEVLVKINRVGKHIDSKFAHKYYDQIGLGIDFTARDLQKKLKDKGLPWEKSKAFDGSAVVGKWVSKSSFDDLSNLPFSLHKNNTIVQSSSTKDMLWTIDEIIAYVSQFFTLKIGDIIFTGTPSGVSRVEADDTLKGYIGEDEFFSIKVK
jgi:2-keto-4-pentenoate hydratase/2-oxohepta-3-ene-1,7-dioic acid hydratase in catechol pathway